MYTTFEEYQKQFTEWQKQFLSTWMNGLPSGSAVFQFPESVTKSIEYQEEQIKSYLSSQETATKVALDSQRKYWESYFDFARQSMSAMNKTV